MQFTFVVNSQIAFGKGSRFKINELLIKHNWKSLCLIIDHGIAKLPIVTNLIDSISINNINIIEYPKRDIAENIRN